MKHGVIIANRTNRRLVRLDDGTEVTFTPEVCVESPHVEEHAWVEVAADGTRALVLTTIDPGVRARVAAADVLPTDLLEQIRATRLASGLDVQTLSAIVDDLGVDPDDGAAVAHVLDAYYGERPELARAAGWVSADWRTPVRDFVSALAAAVGGSPLLAVTGVVERDTTERGYRERRARVKFATRMGEIERDVELLTEVVVLANEQLASAGDARRFVDLTVDDQVIAVLAAPDAARAIAAAIAT